VFGVLVIVLGGDRVIVLSFRSGERQIPLVVASRVLRALRLGVAGLDVHCFGRPTNDGLGPGG